MCEQSQQSGRSHTPGLLAALARWAVRRNRLVLAAAALLVVAGLLSSGVSAHLGAGGWIAEDTPSARVRSMLGQSRHGGMPPLLLLARITGSVDDAAARSAGTRLVEDLRQEPGVTAVDSYWTGPLGQATKDRPSPPPDPLLRSSDGRTALIALWLEADERTQLNVAERVLARATGPNSPLETQAAGQAAVARAATPQ
ncbi:MULTISPECIES: hypothetical protein [unclassified Streptomyces]|uniref:hypothetical protein n=1 Tax=unclassified Streptomyces TaxID=2593676 RepID=UPI002E36C122|nr:MULTISPECIES: hypothetical protein [unclassified Streptomyces]WUC63604.1 hypothetical protein OG861_04855 [Streptomyces sp. NBC_00539]